MRKAEAEDYAAKVKGIVLEFADTLVKVASIMDGIDDPAKVAAR